MGGRECSANAVGHVSRQRVWSSSSQQSYAGSRQRRPAIGVRPMPTTVLTSRHSGLQNRPAGPDPWRISLQTMTVQSPGAIRMRVVSGRWTAYRRSVGPAGAGGVDPGRLRVNGEVSTTFPPGGLRTCTAHLPAQLTARSPRLAPNEGSRRAFRRLLPDQLVVSVPGQEGPDAAHLASYRFPRSSLRASPAARSEARPRV
jgi:hypothetical protein